MKKREIWRFIGVVYVLGFTAELLGVRAGVSGAGREWLKLAMWAPALAVLTSRAARRTAWAALRRSGGRWVAAGLAVGWSFTLLQQVLLLLGRGGRWNAALFTLNANSTAIAAVHKVGMALGVGAQGFGFFALNLAVSITIGSMLGGVLGGLGEELGWRAVLQPELERRWGPLRGSLAVGLVWAYWHLPVNLAGYNDAKHPVWNALVFFPLVVVAMAFAFGWLQRRSKSVWPAALAHGANNCIQFGFLLAPASWGWDTATALGGAALIGGCFAFVSVRRAGSERCAAKAGVSSGTLA